MASDSGHTLYTAADTLSQAPGRNAAASHISKTYRQASTLFLTRRLPEALSTVLPLVTPSASDDPNGPFEPAPVAKASRSSKVKVWSLYLTVLNAIVELDSDEGKEAFGTQEWRALCHKVREGEVWEEVVRNGYHGIEGDVDAEVVINLATLLLAHAKNQILNQKFLENYLAAARTPNLDIYDRFSESTPRRYSSPAAGNQHRRGAPSGADTPRDLNARVKILELYTLHVLPRNSEWDYAREFISVSPVLDDERREAFLQALESLREEQLAAERREEEERLKREEAIRRDIEEARRLRAENEAREKRRLEEERLKRERDAAESSAAKATEGDFGLDERAATPPTAGSKPKPPSSQSSTGSSMPRPRGPVPRRGSGGSGNAVVAPTPTLMSRASMVLDNLRLLVDEVAGAFKTNPYVLLRMLAFVIGLLLLLSRKRFRERIAGILEVSWGKIKATAGMGTKIDDLGTPIPIFLEARALEAVEGVRDALAAAHHALVLVIAEAAFVAYSDQRRRPHVRVAHRALAVALVAEPSDGNAGLFAAHYEIAIAGRRVSNTEGREGGRGEITYGILSRLVTLRTSQLFVTSFTDGGITSKRKASPEVTSQDGAGKRVKLGDGDENAPRLNGVDSELKEGQTKDVQLVKEQAERGPSILEEKKRGQRLFGSLVSTLSRTTSRPQQQKRLEIERRQHEKAQQRRAEDEKRRAERLEQLKRTRQIEQVKLDEQAMKIRHSTMLAMAHSLQTRSEPKLYYVPWELTKEQEDIVNDQIRATRDVIQREAREFKTRKEQRFKALGVTPPPRSPSPPRQKEQLPEPEPDAEPRSKEATVGEPKPPPQDANPDTVAPTPSKVRTYHEKEHDENGDEMMQDEEDIVIY
ncbi:pinin/SDK/memA/ protein conserved region-domain-containing protein [Achaetomium macrosporum]|uniref:Pinin/SDK/memA/ protein conserved region-domain-containing protein n=1 Tax=Achaetomium macrosporum TaxID=79813 RepID=A0AAN7H7E4_9PEZI|nr:pinin/SDK/memA/ protein conserved region-domain-containing protein [Achaetomium macrosporum]